MADISLEPEEEIVWQGTINRKILGYYFILIFLPVLAFSSYAFSQNSVGFSQCSGRYTFDRAACTALHPDMYVNGFLLGSVVIGIGILLLIVNLIWQLAQEYTVTSKRVIIKSWLFRTTYKFLYFSDMRGVLNSQGWLGRMFDCGTIKIDIGEKYSGMSRNMVKYVCMFNINAPDKAYEYIHSAIANAESIPSSMVDDSVTGVGTRDKALLWKILSICVATPFIVLIFFQIKITFNQYQKLQQSQVQSSDDIKIEQGQALLGPLQVDKAINGRYPATLEDSSSIQSVQKSMGIGTAIPLNDFTYQVSTDENNFNLCIQLSTGQKCWSAADIPQ